MRILLTGGSGFLGSHLAAELIGFGHEVTVLLRPKSDAWRLAPIADRVRVLHGSLDERDSHRTIIDRAGPEGIAHLAWAGVGNLERNSPRQARNIATTVELLDAASDAGVRVFVGAGSQAEYGPCARPIREDDATQPTTLYGHAKLAAGMMAGRLAQLRGIRFAWLRVFSTYGPKDNPGWLIPDLITKLRKGERMSLTRGEQRWGFLHARDAAAAFRIVLESETAWGVFNVGSPDAPQLRDTILMLKNMVNSNAELAFGEIPYRSDQVMLLQADMARLAALGWCPRVTLADGLLETVSAHA